MPEPLRSADPRELGAYRLVSRLGQGGQGVVYLGEAPDGRKVAVKVLNKEWAGDPKLRERFTKEVNAARRVAHFCTAAVLDAELEAEPPYVISEFVEGPSLQQAIEDSGPRSGEALHKLAVGTATALAAIHEAGVVHRDFKPANVLLAADHLRVVDFGVARVVDSAVTQTASIMGTPAYMAPEQLMGELVTPAVDVFAWGCVIAFAATGKPPFGSDTVPKVMNRVLKEPPNLDGFTGPLRTIVEEALDKEKQHRPSASLLLSRLLLGHGSETPLPIEQALSQGQRTAVWTQDVLWPGAGRSGGRRSGSSPATPASGPQPAFPQPAPGTPQPYPAGHASGPQAGFPQTPPGGGRGSGGQPAWSAQPSAPQQPAPPQPSTPAQGWQQPTGYNPGQGSGPRPGQYPPGGFPPGPRPGAQPPAYGSGPQPNPRQPSSYGSGPQPQQPYGYQAPTAGYQQQTPGGGYQPPAAGGYGPTQGYQPPAQGYQQPGPGGGASAFPPPRPAAEFPSGRKSRTGLYVGIGIGAAVLVVVAIVAVLMLRPSTDFGPEYVGGWSGYDPTNTYAVSVEVDEGDTAQLSLAALSGDDQPDCTYALTTYDVGDPEDPQTAGHWMNAVQGTSSGEVECPAYSYVVLENRDGVLLVNAGPSNQNVPALASLYPDD